MERLDIYLYTYLEINRDDFSSALMSFYELGSTNLVNSYQDLNANIHHTSPVVAGYDGRFPKIFINKPYRVEIKNNVGLLIFSDEYE